MVAIRFSAGWRSVRAASVVEQGILTPSSNACQMYLDFLQNILVFDIYIFAVFGVIEINT
jgi:hypothetical protein